MVATTVHRRTGGSESSMTETLQGLDLAQLAAYLRREVPGLLAGPLTGRLISGGRSNLTYLADDGTQQLVVRRPPLGHVLATAHDMTREYRIMAALEHSEVPVPHMVVLCEDTDIIGAPFFVMSFVDGVVYRTEEQLAPLAGRAAEELADALVDVLVRLHATDPAAVGLADLGRPQGYLERQVARWGKQLTASRSRDIPGAEGLARRLAGTVPASQRSGLVHGDYKLDNLVIDRAAPGHALAVLDWEMATLGDPLMDLVNLAVWWDGVYDVHGSPFTGVPARVPGFPSSEQMLDRYALLAAADVSALPWYFGLMYYKLAGIFEGMYFRDRQGLTVGPGFELLEGLAPALVQRGHQVLDQAGH
jgi:aminoglycoside phosphotransferase (APT) family kinase protein